MSTETTYILRSMTTFSYFINCQWFHRLFTAERDRKISNYQRGLKKNTFPTGVAGAETGRD